MTNQHPEPEWHQAIAKRAIESCLAQRDEVLAAFIAKYGFQPENVIQVEQRQPDGTSTWRIERRPGPKPEELRVEDLEATARAAEIQPEPVAPTLKEVSDWILLEKKKGARWATATDHHEALPIACAAMHHALARWGAPAAQPVPVSERLPGPEDCDSEGRCWVGYAVPKDDLDTEYNPSWELCKVHPQDEVWLPHWALPVPANTTEEANR
jgi:hypothetical protein